MGHVDISLHLPNVIINTQHAGTSCPEPFTNYTSEGSVSYQHVLFEDDVDERTAEPKVAPSSFLSSLQLDGAL